MISVNKNGKLLFLVNNISSICAGKIGTSGKVCCRDLSECSIAKHKQQKLESLEPGYYVKVNEGEIITTNFVPKEMVNKSLEAILLYTEFKPKQLNAIMQVLNHQDKPGELKLDDLNKALKGLTEGTILKTPAVKRRKLMSFDNKYSTILENLEESFAESVKGKKEDDTARASLKEFCAFTVDSLLKDEEAIGGLGQQLEFIQNSIGDDQDETQYANIWAGILDLKYQVEQVGIRLAGTVDKSSLNAEVNSSTQPIKSDLITLNNNAQNAFSAVESKLLELERAISTNHQNTPGFLHSTLGSSSEVAIKQELLRLQSQFDTLQSNQNSSGSGSSNQDGKERVTVGQYTFNTIQDLAAWSANYLPASLPFGSFVDVYSYLERVNSFKDVASTTVLKNMEIRKKLDLTADEALIIESFKHALPRIFNGGSSSSTVSSGAWLPGIPTKDKWEDNVGLSSAKITIRDNEATIRSRIEEVISQRLSGYQEAQSLARILLSDTIAFIGCLNRFISETYKRLEELGFGKLDSWKLVSKLVHRVFATDCHHRRGAVSEFLDASDAKTLSLGVLWGTFATHQVMREYMQHGIENHPSISSEYVRFLVANCGLERISKLEAQNEKLSSEVAELEKLVASQGKSLSTVANKAEEAIKLAKKRPRQEQS